MRRRVEDLQNESEKNPLQPLHGAELGGKERCSALDEVGVVRGSELHPVEVARGAALSGDDLSGEVVPGEEPTGTKDRLQVENRVVLGVGESRGRRGRRGRR